MKKILFLLFAIFSLGWTFAQNGFQKITITDTLSEIARPHFADFNGDGLLDVVVNDFYNLRILLYTQNADHTFSGKVIISGLASNPRCVAVYDFNGDSAIDIAAIVNDNLYVFFNDGNNNFPRSTNFYDGKVQKLALIDYNNDGNMDLIGTANYQFDEFVHIYKNNGNETFTTVDPGFPGDGTNDVVVADFDNDGNEDFAVITPNYLIAYKNNGDGTFTKFYIDTLSFWSVDAIDFNGDTLPDLVVFAAEATSYGYVVIYENQGNFSFKQVYNSGNISAFNGYAKAGDFNKDGLVDIAFATNNNQDFQWLKNSGNYNFTKLYVTGDMSSPALYRADFDKDGKLDILVGTYGKIHWLKNKHLFPTAHFPLDTVVCGQSQLQLVVSEPDADSIVWYGIYEGTTVQLTENMGMTGVNNDTLIFYKDSRPDSVQVFAKLMNNYDITAYSDTINIKNESQPPTLITKTTTVYINAYGYAVINKADLIDTAYDQCGLLDTVISVDTVTCNDVGNISLYITVRDKSLNGNTQTVNVTVRDIIAPILEFYDTTYVYLDSNGNATFDPMSAVKRLWDNCKITDTTLIIDKKLFSCSDIGSYTLKGSLTDASSNSAEDSAIVIVTDTIKPKITCKDSLTFDAAPNNHYTVQGNELDATAWDNCSYKLTNNLNGQSSLADYQLPAGENTIIWTATDSAGNKAVCTTYVRVNAWASVRTLEGIKIYPNPANDYLTINAQFTGQILIMDQKGKVLIKQKIQPGIQHINIKSLQAGIYLLQIKSLKTNATVPIIKY